MVHALRSMGSAAMNYTQVAMGGLDLYWYVITPPMFVLGCSLVFCREIGCWCVAKRGRNHSLIISFLRLRPWDVCVRPCLFPLFLSTSTNMHFRAGFVIAQEAGCLIRGSPSTLDDANWFTEEFFWGRKFIVIRCIILVSHVVRPLYLLFLHRSIPDTPVRALPLVIHQS